MTQRSGSRRQTQACRTQLGSRGSPAVRSPRKLTSRLPSRRGARQMTRSGAISGSPGAERASSRSGSGSRGARRRREGGIEISSTSSAECSGGRCSSSQRSIRRRSTRLAASVRKTTRWSGEMPGQSGPAGVVRGGAAAMATVYRFRARLRSPFGFRDCVRFAHDELRMNHFPSSSLHYGQSFIFSTRILLSTGGGRPPSPRRPIGNPSWTRATRFVFACPGRAHGLGRPERVWRLVG